MLLHYKRPVLPCWVILTSHKTTSCQHILFQMVVFFKKMQDICHFEAPAYMIGSCMKVLFISWNGFYWKEMHFHVNVLEFAAPHCCLPPWFWLYSQFLLLVFWQVAEGICFGLFLPDLWDSADIQESAAKKPVAHIQAYVFRGRATSTELKFLDNKSYLWRNKHRRYFVGPCCSLSVSNIWLFYARGQIGF